MVTRRCAANKIKRCWSAYRKVQHERRLAWEKHERAAAMAAAAIPSPVNYFSPIKTRARDRSDDVGRRGQSPPSFSLLRDATSRISLHSRSSLHSSSSSSSANQDNTYIFSDNGVATPKRTSPVPTATRVDVSSYTHTAPISENETKVEQPPPARKPKFVSRWRQGGAVIPKAYRRAISLSHVLKTEQWFSSEHIFSLYPLEKVRSFPKRPSALQNAHISDVPQCKGLLLLL